MISLRRVVCVGNLFLVPFRYILPVFSMLIIIGHQKFFIFLHRLQCSNALNEPKARVVKCVILGVASSRRVIHFVAQRSAIVNGTIKWPASVKYDSPHKVLLGDINDDSLVFTFIIFILQGDSIAVKIPVSSIYLF